MTRHEIPAGRILGIPIGVDLSWFLIFGLMTWSLAVSYYPAEFKNWSAAEYWLVGALTSVALFASVLVHELGHSAVAMRLGLPVKRITLFIFGGVSEIAAEAPRPGVEFLVSIVGPLVSFGLALVFWALEPLVAGTAPLLAMTKYLALINGLLALFNLIPGFPLDGGRVLVSILWSLTHSLRRATRTAASVGRLIAFVFIAWGVLQIFSGNLINGLWIAFIGWFMESAGAAQVQQQVLADLLAGHKVQQAMVTDYVSVTSDTTLQAIVDRYVLGGGHRTFVVTEAGSAIGILTLHNIKDVSREQWPATPASKAMIPLDKTLSVPASADISSAIHKLDRTGVNQLPVLSDNKLVGILSRDSFIHYLGILQELGAA